MNMAKMINLKSSIGEFKTDLERDYMIRRYQKIVHGSVPIEERIGDLITHSYVYLVTSWRLFIKRTLDLTLSLFGIIFGLPLFAVIAIAIKLDSRGPVLYKQERVGMRGKTFFMYKFRSMREDAEYNSGPVWAKEHDPRVTKLGSFLRKTHLDELPQLFNVLVGEMSIVGPRPERPYFVKQLRKQIPHYDRRHYAKPGITGLAQIKRRYDETLSDVKKKVRYDVLYIRKMCPFLDLKVVGLTVLTIIYKTGR